MHRALIIILVGFLFSCKSEIKKETIHYLSPLVDVFLLKDTSTNKIFHAQKAYSFTLKQREKSDKIVNTYLYIYQKNDSVYLDIKKWFTNQFGEASSNNSVDFWKDDNKEYLLHKQDDSTIFVNIYTK